jgi:hypothetical protein
MDGLFEDGATNLSQHANSSKGRDLIVKMKGHPKWTEFEDLVQAWEEKLKEPASNQSDPLKEVSSGSGSGSGSGSFTAVPLG